MRVPLGTGSARAVTAGTLSEPTTISEDRRRTSMRGVDPGARARSTNSIGISHVAPCRTGGPGRLTTRPSTDASPCVRDTTMVRPAMRDDQAAGPVLAQHQPEQAAQVGGADVLAAVGDRNRQWLRPGRGEDGPDAAGA